MRRSLIHRRVTGAVSAFAVCASLLIPVAVDAGPIVRGAIRGAVAGAVVGEIVNGDAAQGARIGAGVGRFLVPCAEMTAATEFDTAAASGAGGKAKPKRIGLGNKKARVAIVPDLISRWRDGQLPRSDRPSDPQRC